MMREAGSASLALHDTLSHYQVQWACHG